MARILPVMLLKDVVLLPKDEIKVELNHSLSFLTLTVSEEKFDNEIILVSPKDSLEEMPEVSDLPLVAVIGKIVKKITLPNEHIRVTIKGIKRVKISKYFNGEDDVLECSYYVLQLPKLDDSDVLATKRELKKMFKKYIKTNPNLSNDSLSDIQNLDLNDLTDYIASVIPTSKDNRTFYMEEVNALTRANQLIDDLIIELKIMRLDQKINEALQSNMEKSQKEYVLKEKLKEIQKELGEENKKSVEVNHYYDILKDLNLLNSTRQKITNEIKKYEVMSEMSPEITFSRNYLELFFSLPWNEETIECEDLKMIEKCLNKSHYGLENVKSRILEFVAMKKRNPLLQSPIICLVGPPGVGKSTIASSIATALHRKFYKISVGGLNDSSELIGNRRSYIGSAPGKIIQALQKCGSKNPLILIDEVDKMVKDYKGDPASTLLDILDANLNQSFTDAYLEEPFDLSRVLFILTANYIDKIPSELKDRLEIIELSSYTVFEKISLANSYLIPRIRLNYHLRDDEIVLDDDTIKTVITDYTNEAGVRDLQRKLESLFRKIILNSEKNHKSLEINVLSKDLARFLEDKNEMLLKPKIITSGLVNSLAVNDNGGLVLPIEAIMYDGKGEVIVTGLLGDVMQESLSVVKSFLKYNAKDFQINEFFLKEKDIHLHFLSSAMPKNGPSAGVAITTALISLLTNKIVDSNFAFTGEMTLRGEILPVGGVKEKIIGAYNYGITDIFIPLGNKKDVPKEVKDKMNIIFVKDYKDIYKKIFK